MKNAIWVEFRSSIFIVVAPLLVVAGVWYAFTVRDNSGAVIASWSAVSSYTLTASNAIIPFISGGAAWAALRSIFRRASHPTEKTSARFHPVIYLPRLIVSLVYVLAAYAVIVGIVLTRSIIIGLHGPVDVSPLIYAVILPLAFVVISTSITVLIPNGLAIVLAFLFPLVFRIPNGFTWFPVDLGFFGGMDLWSSMNIFVQFDWSSLTLSNWRYFLFLSGFVLSLAAVFAFLAFMRHAAYRLFSSLAVAVSAGALVAFTALFLGQGGHTSRVVNPNDWHYVTVYNRDRTLSITMQDYFLPIAGDLLKLWSPIATAFAKSSLAFHHIQQVDNYAHRPPVGGFGTMALQVYSGNTIHSTVGLSFMDALERLAPCYGGNSGYRNPPPSGDFGIGGDFAFTEWINKGYVPERPDPNRIPKFYEELDAQMGPQYAEETKSALRWLESLDTPELQTWIAKHVHNIMTCNWNTGDFGGR